MPQKSLCNWWDRTETAHDRPWPLDLLQRTPSRRPPHPFTTNGSSWIKFSPLRILQPMNQFTNHRPNHVYSPEWLIEVFDAQFSNRNVRVTCSAHLYLHVLNISVIYFGSNPLIILHSFQTNPSLQSYRMNEQHTYLAHNVWKFKSYEIWRHADWEILTNVSDHPVLLECKIREGWTCSTRSETGNDCII